MKMRNTLENKNIERQETATPRLMLRLLALALLVIGGWSGAVAQTFETGTLEEGFFYIVHNQDRTYSLCPAEDPSDHAIGKWYNDDHTMPFLTTKKTNLPDDYRLWHLTKNSSGNFQMIHAKDNKYVINDKTGNDPVLC